MMQYYYLHAFTNRKQTCHALTIGWKGKGNYSEYEKEMKRRLIDEIEKRKIEIRYNKNGQPILYFSYASRNFVSGVEILFGLAKTTKYAGKRVCKTRRRKVFFELEGLRFHPGIGSRFIIKKEAYRCASSASVLEKSKRGA